MKTDKTIQNQLPPVIISSELKDFDNDPYVLKKAEHAKEMIRKRGFPGGIKK